MLCGEDHAGLGLVSSSERDLPAAVMAMFDAGHITQSEFNSLPPEMQAKINPHEVESDLADGPIDFDAILGIPTSVQTGREADGNEADALPDLFPALDGGFSLDQTSQSGRTLLRFGTQVNNQGMGPCTLISGRPGVDSIPSGAPITSWVNPDGSQNVLQAVYNYNSGTNSFNLSYYRAAGRFTYHTGHGHFHYDGYANYALRQRNANGTPGAYVMRPDGTGVVGAKTGFCLININSSFTMLSGSSSTTIPSYSATGQPSTGCGLLQGISVGRADVYSSNLEGQWLDVTGVPNGQYFLEMSMDGENAVLEPDDANNTRTFAVTVNANPPSGGIPADQYDTGTNNNSLANAVDMGVLGTFTKTGLSIHFGLDSDYFEFQASSTGTYTVTTTGTGGTGNIDLYLYDANGNQLRASTGTSSSESVSFPFVQGDTYYIKTEAYNSQTVNNYQVAWNLKPLVTNSINAAASEVGLTRGSVVIARNGPTTSPLTVTFALGGTATFGQDYTISAPGLINNSTLSLGDLQSSSTLEIIPLNDTLVEGTETVTVTVTSSTAYVIGGTAAQTVNIADIPPAVTGSDYNRETLPLNVSFNFSLNVGASLDADDVQVYNVDTREVMPITGVVYDSGLNRGRFNMAGVLPDGHYEVTLSRAGVTHSLGTPLAADSGFTFNVFAGDADGNGAVNIDDFGVLAANFNSPGTYSQGDFNYSGVIDIDDFGILAAKFNTALGAAARAASALPGRVGSTAFSAAPIGSVIDLLELSDANGNI